MAKRAQMSLTIVRFVHQPHYNFLLVRILLREFLPQVGEDVRAGTSLADDLAIPACVVVDVNDTVCSGLEARLHQLIICGEVSFVQLAKLVVRKILPAYGQAEYIELVDLGKVLHLTRPIPSFAAS